MHKDVETKLYQCEWKRSSYYKSSLKQVKINLLSLLERAKHSKTA